MLKNVAIPLMLAATEAEAQSRKEQVKEAMMADLGKRFDGLIADAEACTADNADIGNLAQAVSTADTAVLDAQKAVTDLRAGAWGTADTARKEAVTAAVTLENAANIAGLLDTLDTKLAEERTAAEIYVTAKNAFNVGTTAAADALVRNNAAIAQEDALKGLRDSAVQAVADVRTQITKETTWKEWLYCELGDTVSGDGFTATQWYKGIASLASSVSTPNSCTVPAVSNAAGTVVRPSVEYFGATANLAAERYINDTNPAAVVVITDLSAESNLAVVTWQKWTAALRKSRADTDRDATTNYQSHSRTKAGEVAWATGDLRSKLWQMNQRTREQAFVTSVHTTITNMLALATSQADTATYDTPASATTTMTKMGLTTTGAAGAAKALATALQARDDGLTSAQTLASGQPATTGSYAMMPNTRTQSNEVTTWVDPTHTSIEQWKLATGYSTSAVRLWWAKAGLVSEAAQTWHAAYATDSAQITAGSFVTAEVQTADLSGSGGAAAASGHCTSHSSYTASPNKADGNQPTTVAECKTACEAVSIAVLLADQGSENGGAANPDIVNGGVGYCGAYSWKDNEATADKCKHLLNAAVSANDVTALASSQCFNVSNVADWKTKASAIKTALNNLEIETSALKLNIDLVTAADAQAALEKAWLEAWYLQQYWSQLKTWLTVGTAGSKAETWSTLNGTLENAQVVDSTSTAGATAAHTAASTLLDTTTSALAVLTAACAAADATVAELGTRITRANAEIVILRSLAADDTTSGTLDAAATLRTADYDAYVKTTAVLGEFKVAADALSAANAAVLARTGASTTDGGALVEAAATTLAAWTLAQGAVTTARSNLTDALAGGDLEDLRATVVSTTATWTTENGNLDGLIGTLEAKELLAATAADNLAEATQKCRVDAYDAYRTTLEELMVQRAADLTAIKALLDSEVTPAPGTIGARCEKAISNGTFRPKRGELSCGSEANCCGAARIPMDSSAWRTIETCQDATATQYSYQPPRAPMATTFPASANYPFTCIEGAKKLAAAASAVAAAVYMLA